MAGKRGTYAKTAARKQEILNTALEVIAKEGYSKASLKQVADAVGLSQMGVLHHFKTKEELLVEVLNRRDQLALDGFDLADLQIPEDIGKILATSGKHIDEIYVEMARQNAGTPGLIQLFSWLLIEGTEKDHAAHDFFQARTPLVFEFIKVAIIQEQEQGYISQDVDPELTAISFAALMDGLQTLWLYDPSIAMENHIRAYWDLLRTSKR